MWKRFTMALAAAAALGACASVDEAATGARSTADDCFFAGTLRDWRPLDNSNLILFANGRRPYHVELMQPAAGLSFNVTIGVYDRDGRVCPYGGDAIIVDGGFMPERIAIRSMRELTDEELDAVYVQFGIRPPAVVESVPVELEETED